MFKNFTASLMLFLVIFQVACGASTAQTLPTIPTNLGDASAAFSPDVQLLGLPSDAGQVSVGDASAEVGPVLIPGNGQAGEMIVPLRQNDRAPYNGVLFNGPAVARVQVEFRAVQDRCVIDRQREVELMVARYNADVASLRLAMDTQRQMDQLMLNSRDQDVARLNRLLDQQRASNGPDFLRDALFFGGGLLLGAAVMGGAVLYMELSRP